MRRGSSARAGGRLRAAARYGSGEESSISQIQPVRNPSSSATCDSVNPSASPSTTERLSSRAISFSTESSWLRLSRSSFPGVCGPDNVASLASVPLDEFISVGLDKRRTFRFPQPRLLESKSLGEAGEGYEA